ncbi:MlotiK1 channel [uncultured Eubacterium sp.]|uniref:ion transporter n=1 Tax=Emergencia sp. TaxID=1926557 RepID=UPI000822772D|nr:MlotiK1 channel [uncultured Eubacterium sp.]
MNKKKRIFTIIQVGSIDDIPSRTYDIALMFAVAVNIFIAIFETFPQSSPYLDILSLVEGITVLFFTVDYILRIWTASYLYKGVTVARARRKFIFSWAGIVDFLSCIPYYLPFFFPRVAVALRMFRIIRILRIFRIHHYSDPLQVIGRVLKKKRGQLLSSIFIVLILMIAASLMMYSLEHTAQPQVFDNAFSGFWWAINTLLTVGYGDIVPITFAGKVCGAIMTFLGVGMVAIPTGILSAGFVEQMRPKPKEKETHYCPNCGHKLD